MRANVKIILMPLIQWCHVANDHHYCHYHRGSVGARRRGASLRWSTKRMTSNFFIIHVVYGSQHTGKYRIMASTREVAEQRALTSFHNEFGCFGKVDYVEQVANEKTNQS